MDLLFKYQNKICWSLVLLGIGSLLTVSSEWVTPNCFRFKPLGQWVTKLYYSRLRGIQVQYRFHTRLVSLVVCMTHFLEQLSMAWSTQCAFEFYSPLYLMPSGLLLFIYSTQSECKHLQHCETNIDVLVDRFFFLIFIKCIRAETAAECELHRKKKYNLQSKCRGISVCSCCSITWNPDHFASAFVKLLSSSLPSAWPEPASGGAGPFRRHHPQADRSDTGGGPERHPVPVTGSACAGEN